MKLRDIILDYYKVIDDKRVFNEPSFLKGMEKYLSFTDFEEFSECTSVQVTDYPNFLRHNRIYIAEEYVLTGTEKFCGEGHIYSLGVIEQPFTSTFYIERPLPIVVIKGIFEFLPAKPAPKKSFIRNIYR